MHCFKLPIGLCNELKGLIMRFLWGQRGDRRKIHWVRWEELYKPKSERGIGFKNFALFNDALLANQAWRLLQNKNSLLYRVFKPKIFPNCSFMEALDSQASSYAWWSILKGREVLKKGMRWRVGDGSSIRIWSDPWLPSTFMPFISSLMALGWEEATMASLLDYPNQGWRHDTLNLLFSPKDKELIQLILLCGLTLQPGHILWNQAIDFSTNQGAWIMESTIWTTTNYGRKCGECKCSPRFETFCGGSSGIQFQQNTI